MATQMIQWLSPDHNDRADLAVLIVSWNVKELVLKNIEAWCETIGTGFGGGGGAAARTTDGNSSAMAQTCASARFGLFGPV
jgi:hypothetical protein